MIDAESLMLVWLQGRDWTADARVVSEKPGSITGRLVWVNRIGGPAALAIDHPRVQVECFDTNPTDSARAREPARALAYEVCGAMLKELRGFVAVGGTVTDVSVGSGPFWLPWENTNVRRFGIAAQLTIR